MRILVCLDDTDNLESRGTGELAEDLAGELIHRSWGTAEFITRHQLLLHPEIAYTSHNSAMCFSAMLKNCPLDFFIQYSSEWLANNSASGSDPGLCVVQVDKLNDPMALIRFGETAKKQVLSKKQAYGLAAQLDIHLSEHGGSGAGVIGALAGAGLRLGGNDGRLKGRLKQGEEGRVYSVAEICAHSVVTAVYTLDRQELSESEKIQWGSKVKTVLLDGRAVLLVVPQESSAACARWRTCTRQELDPF